MGCFVLFPCYILLCNFKALHYAVFLAEEVQPLQSYWIHKSRNRQAVMTKMRKTCIVRNWLDCSGLALLYY